jgi:hypothetical protein
MQSVDWIGYRIAAWAIAVILACLAVYAGLTQSWQNGLVLGGFAVAMVIYLAAQSDVPAVFNVVMTASVALNAGGWAWQIFNSIWGYDEVAHALGTLGMTLVIGWYGYRPIGDALRGRPWVMLLAVSALGISLGALWEITEWIGYWFFAQPSVQVLDDKISEMVADSVGALVAAAFFRWALVQRSQHSDAKLGAENRSL